MGAHRLDYAERGEVSAKSSGGAPSSASDLFLAARLGDGTLKTDIPLSARVSGVIGPDGVPQKLPSGRIVADAGSISETNVGHGRIAIERAEFKLNWDAANRVLSVPFQICPAATASRLLGKSKRPRKRAASGHSRSAAARSC